jgi:hypothetical protein
LIDRRVGDLRENGQGDTAYKFLCLDTQLVFETYDHSALYSPFTGSSNIEYVGTEDYSMYGEEEGFMTPSKVPSSQRDMRQQKPLKSNPSGAKSLPWKTKRGKSNPAPDKGSVMGSSASKKGYVR